MFIGGLHPETTLKELSVALSGYTPVKNLKLIQDRATGLNKGYAFFKVRSLEAASTLLTTDIIIRERVLQCQVKSQPGSRTPVHRLFVGGLPSWVTDHSLQLVFS